ncbi:N-acetylglucosaminyldiphosphoundecaprenol N-acetyl-beta-D-mannosaminyltransferase [Friedmanniella endophytica]|uniref:N-acetylglucosaminyldiphosphoundecaprenol N-acetyl-beta-D-mannosaminyltransferase n=1 Tax=Microlunatus kandeliicorticis TaxID=1759536 RepID=A0A7W3P4C5_9ACTN|nr:WecB/TagA/CpsF family glycosyltransferase [Microlunatus kandeliicorticis]MBA8792690.1 N-acetylglucosaminyldiphosphoundecaprenol N-acetyl-beta-D-mannosaminyltransferase [Microlunatus kandeliicorticis]
MLKPAAPARQMFGLKIDALTLDDVIWYSRRAIENRQRLLIGVVNAAKVINLRTDASLRESLMECDLVLADGQSVVWAGVVLKQRLPERVAGIDIFQELLALADAEHRSVYLLGARAEVLEKLVAVINQRYPGARVVGSRDGYFTEDESAGVAAKIREAGADMLFLGITSPKKEIFLGTYGSQLDVPVLHGVGGSFDVLAGVTQRAPQLWQRVGMEWAYRLKQEPSRLWRRYLNTNSRFVGLVVQEYRNRGGIGRKITKERS